MHYTKAIVQSVCRGKDFSVKLTPCSGLINPNKEKSILFFSENQKYIEKANEIQVLSVQDTFAFLADSKLENFLLTAFEKKMKVGVYIDEKSESKYIIKKVETC